MHSYHVFPCAFFCVFKVLLGAAVVLGHAWKALIPGPLPPPASVWPLSPGKKEGQQPRRSWELHAHSVICQIVGMATSRGHSMAQVSASLQHLAWAPCLWVTSTKVHRAVPACRKVTTSDLDAQAFFRVQFPPRRSCPCSFPAGKKQVGLKEQASVAAPSMLGLCTHRKGWQQCRTRGAGAGWERFPVKGRYHIPFGCGACAVRSFPGAVYPWCSTAFAVGGESFT